MPTFTYHNLKIIFFENCEATNLEQNSISPVNRLEMITDRDLIIRCKNGDKESQTWLYERYAPILMGICMRYARNEEDARDILHDSFVKILTNIDKVDADDAYIAWMKTITVNTAISAYHSKKRNTLAMIDEVEDIVEDVRIQQSDFLTHEMLLRFINDLPDGYRAVFNLHEIDGYSHIEISEILGCSYSTVRSQLFKAKRTLKKNIEDYLGINDLYDTEKTSLK